MSNDSELTVLLAGAGRGDRDAQDRLYELLYSELRAMAGAQMARERAGHTIQPTMLVNDIFVKLAASGAQSWENRRHFYGAAAEAMRRILIDYARARDAIKRRAPGGRETLENVAERSMTGDLDVELLDRGMQALAAEHPRQAEVVRLRFYLGLSWPEIHGTLGLSERMAQYDWKFARAWLLDYMRRADETDGAGTPSSGQV